MHGVVSVILFSVFQGVLEGKKLVSSGRRVVTELFDDVDSVIQGLGFRGLSSDTGDVFV